MMMIRLISVALALAAAVSHGDTATATVATFSIVAIDRETGELGVAVQSKVPAVGAIVPFARAGVGAVATQAAANPSYGPKALERLAAGEAPDAVVKALTAADPQAGRRQLAVIDARGRVASHTGDGCLAWAGGRAGNGYAVQGNILAGREVVDAMAKAFEDSTGPLADRLIAALAAGQDAGGDKRGRQSAALLIVRKGWGYAGLNDRFRDLRVDDHPTPIAELRRVLGVHRKIFRRPQD